MLKVRLGVGDLGLTTERCLKDPPVYEARGRK